MQPEAATLKSHRWAQAYPTAQVLASRCSPSISRVPARPQPLPLCTAAPEGLLIPTLLRPSSQHSHKANKGMQLEAGRQPKEALTQAAAEMSLLACPHVRKQLRLPINAEEL